MKTWINYFALFTLLAQFVVAEESSLESVKMTSMGWPVAVSNEQAWQKMPSAISGSGQAIPIWARMMVKQMPKTTASFLQLDYAQRMSGPVNRKLRAAMRWVAANANLSPYGESIALADLRREGETESRLLTLADGSFKGWTPAEIAALEFAKAMTVHSDDYTDEQFANLVASFDANQAASMVLHMAYANFQDRWLIVLGSNEEEDGKPLPPVNVSFNTNDLKTEPSSQSQTTTDAVEADEPLVASKHDGPAHTWLSYDGLQARLEAQRKRSSRLPSPDWTTIAPKLPPGLMDKPSRVVWYQLALGYAPELAVPFEIYMRTAGGEISRNWDRVFGGSVFWMVTDAIKCPYCMGHCEMNWEVAGLTTAQIANQSKILAGNDWKSFTSAEQHALSFAKKLTQSPSSITAADCEQLRHDWGNERAFYLALNSSRYNYMTRISNGFQLTLESDNVFWDYYNLPQPEKK